MAVRVPSASCAEGVVHGRVPVIAKGEIVKAQLCHGETLQARRPSDRRPQDLNQRQGDPRSGPLPIAAAARAI